MSSVPEKQYVPYSRFEQLSEGREILRQEAAAVLGLVQQIDQSFCEAVQLLQECSGAVVVSGIGKAGLIGQKISATFSSTGTPSHFLHPAEAVHGDLGCLGQNDVMLILSNSGETEEVCRLLPILNNMHVPIIAITANSKNSLSTEATVVLTMGEIPEAGALKLAPSTSTTAMLALGDALALVVSRVKNFTPNDFSTFHPGGNLGKQLQTVEEIMRQGTDLRIAADSNTLREILVDVSRPGRRSGAVMLVNSVGTLSGIFTDSDLARLLEQHRDTVLDRPVFEVMTVNPITVSPAARLSEVVEILSARKLSELPVVNDQKQPVGLVDITDVITVMPARTAG